MTTASSTERGGRSPSIAMPFTMRSNSPISSAMRAVTVAWLSRRQQVAASLFVAAAQVRQVGVHAARLPASACRMASSSRSVIFDMAETTTTTGRLLCSSADDARRHAHALGRAHAGAAEFHDEQVVRFTHGCDTLFRW